MEERKVYIELKEESKCVNIIRILKGGRRKEKLISIEDFASSISSSLVGNNIGQVKSAIAREVRGVRLIQSKKLGDKAHVYVLLQAKHNTPLQLFNRFYDNVGVPSLLYGVHVVNNRLSKLYVTAVKDTNILSTTRIFRYPLTNVSGDIGSVCLGRNSFGIGIEDNDLEKLYNVPYQFMSMPNNLDHYRITSNSKRFECEELIKYLNNKEFEDDLLVEENLNYSDWFDKL
ncbi:hypothetical protein [uncultured Clostridium sp.]|uniref:hypothetical protein n=1 Tax=uncultured Clostridium sp. TaxID=59620 RepID=UPI0028F11B53|nr:hypothetical protein [uncultured Clostridium sp.]